MPRIRQHLTYANVMATIAVVGVLAGGGAYAASKIGPRDIARNAVLSKHIRNGQVKTHDLAGSIPAVRVTRTSNQSIPNNPATALIWNSERYDTAGMHSNRRNKSRIKAPVTGIYNITLEVAWSPFDPDGFRYIDLERNGTVEIAIDEVDPPPAGDQSVTTQARLRKGDFIVAFAQQDSGGPLNITKPTTHEYSPELSMTWMAPG
jgi:hypothetical protein